MRGDPRTEHVQGQALLYVLVSLLLLLEVHGGPKCLLRLALCVRAPAACSKLMNTLYAQYSQALVVGRLILSPCLASGMLWLLLAPSFVHVPDILLICFFASWKCMRFLFG
jgi:hypothetical protein